MAWDEELGQKNHKGILNICLCSLIRKNSNMISEIINLLVDILVVRVITEIFFSLLLVIVRHVFVGWTR